MRFFIFFVGICISFISFGQTQAEMNKKAHLEFKKADQELNAIYKKILNEYKSDTIFIKYIKKSQRLWVQFRDAEMDAKYPHPNEYGSIFPVCWSNHKQLLTDDRIKVLKVWLDGIEEGDLCSGSAKTKAQD